jgi:hypothetical protein
MLVISTHFHSIENQILSLLCAAEGVRSQNRDTELLMDSCPRAEDLFSSMDYFFKL